MDWDDCGCATGEGASSISNGLFDIFGDGSFRVRFIDNPAPGLNGERDLETGGAAISAGFTPPAELPPSPSRTRVSIDFSKFPLKPLRTAMFLFSSLKPISRSFSIFKSRSAVPSAPTEAPNTRDCLFLLGSGGDCARASSKSCLAASRRDLDDKGKIEDADLKPNLLPVFGGRGGG